MGNTSSFTNNAVLLAPERFAGTWHTIAAYDLTASERFHYTWDCNSNQFTVARMTRTQTQQFTAQFASQEEDILILTPIYGTGQFTEVVLYTDYSVWAIVSDEARTKYRIMARKSSICHDEKATLIAVTRALGFDPARMKAPDTAIDTCVTVEQSRPAARAVLTSSGTYAVGSPSIAVGSPSIAVGSPSIAAASLPIAGPVVAGQQFVPIVEGHYDYGVQQPATRTTYRSPPIMGPVAPREERPCPIRQRPIQPGSTGGTSLVPPRR